MTDSKVALLIGPFQNHWQTISCQSPIQLALDESGWASAGYAFKAILS
jgi:hypothetical protein